MENLFAERFKNLRLQENLTQNEMSEKLKCNRQKIADLERGKMSPAASDLILIAEEFHISVDYLLGVTDVKTTDKDVLSVCEYTGLSEGAVIQLHKDKSRELEYNYKIWGEYSYSILASWFIEKRCLVELVHEVGVYCAFQDILTDSSGLLNYYEEKLKNLDNLANTDREIFIKKIQELEEETDRNEIFTVGSMYKMHRIITNFAETVYTEWIKGECENNVNNPEKE